MKKSYEMDMCSGHILKKILIFSIPLMLSGVLQLLFNAADVIVVGRFAVGAHRHCPQPGQRSPSDRDGTGLF